MINLRNKISSKEISLIEQGKSEYDFFKSDVEDALLNNTFDEHYIFSSICIQDFSMKNNSKK